MEALIISNLEEARVRFAAFPVTHAVSFRDETFEHPPLDGVVPDQNWVRIFMKDRYSEPGTMEYSKAEGIVESLIAFGEALPDQARVGFNCRAGISRSTAGALICAVAKHGFRSGTDLFEASTRISAPNLSLIEIADDRFGLNGKLTEWVESSVERLYTKRGILIPQGLLKLANKTEDDLSGAEALELTRATPRRLTSKAESGIRGA